jgi:hypothetical protein
LAELSYESTPNFAAARAAAASVGAGDVFVLRRVSTSRFVHLGGVGRGEGWAGIVEVALEEEADLRQALASDEIVRLDHNGRDLVFGPYYARAAAIVPIVPDVLVVFGAADGPVRGSNEALSTAARTTLEVIGPAGPAKDLADQLELLEAIRAASAVDVVPVDRALSVLAEIAVEALSCEIGIAYVADGQRMAVVEHGWSLDLPHDDVRAALAEVTDSHDFPFCVQDARRSPAPGPLASLAGIRSYYLLELTGRARGVLFVAHTDAAPRGFTLLCRRVGARLAEAASNVLGSGLTQEWTSGEAARIQLAFAEIEG